MSTASRNTTGLVERAVRGWLVEMQSCVRAEDYTRCRAIFAADVVAFGSRNAMLFGIDALERQQWRLVWGSIRDFTFAQDDLVWGASGGDIAWLACPWTSTGLAADGSPYPRPGRMTASLARQDGRWVAVHTHHSLTPA